MNELPAFIRPAARPLVVWRLLDGKPGHESQTLGLVRALERLAARGDGVAVHCVDMPLGEFRYTLLDWLFKRFRPGFLQPRPHLIIGAGHRTHWPMLCARRAFGGRAIALMTPSLPASWFNAVVAPRHDGLTGSQILATHGVLNPMRPADKRPGYTVIMVGGISKHFDWDNTRLLQQLEQLMARHPQVALTDSRRTPEALRLELARRWPVVYRPWEQCPPGWLAGELAIADSAWVSEDSVSMIYEALTAGCAVGLIALPPLASKPGRLVRGLQALQQEGLVVRLADVVKGQARLHAANPPLAEADRIATQLVQSLSLPGWPT